VVLRLDDSQLRSDLKIVEGDLYETLAGLARLEAIMEDRRDLILHPVLREAMQQDAEIKALVERQDRQLAAHYVSLDTERHLLDEQILQVREQIVGVEAELRSVTERSTLIETELQQTRDLAEKGLVKLSILYALEKETLINRGDNGRLSARIAELRGKISELELKVLALVPDAKDKLVPELTKLRPEKTRFLEKRNAIIDSLSKLDIRAPVGGRVHDSKVLGLRSVVVAASPLMFIVPTDEPYLVGVRVFATDIDQVYVTQDASLKFQAFNGRKIPIILGEVTSVSADAFLDSLTQKLYYDVEIALIPDEVAKLGQHDLIPGMPIEAFLATESRTPISYFTRPIMDYFNRSFRS